MIPGGTMAQLELLRRDKAPTERAYLAGGWNGVSLKKPEAPMIRLPSIDQMDSWLEGVGHQWQAGQSLVTTWRNFFDPPDTPTQTHEQFRGTTTGPPLPAAAADRNWLPWAIAGAGVLGLIFLLRS